MSTAWRQRGSTLIALAFTAFASPALADGDPASETVLPAVEVHASGAPAGHHSTWTNRTGHAVLDSSSGLMIPPGFSFPYEPEIVVIPTDVTTLDSLVLDPDTGLLVPAAERAMRERTPRETHGAVAPEPSHIDPHTGLMIPRFLADDAPAPLRTHVHGPAARTRPTVSHARSPMPAACRRGATLVLDQATGLMVPCELLAVARH